jgi:hypothetical protein
VKQMEESTCRKARDRVWVKASEVVPGDGASRVKIVVTGPKRYTFVGGHALGLRQGVDQQWTFLCPMSAGKCSLPGNDLSVEQCTVNGSVLTCEYINSKDSPNKLVELGGCFDD